MVGLHLVLLFVFFFGGGGGSWTRAVTAFFDCYCGIYDSTLLLWNVDYTALAKNRFFYFLRKGFFVLRGINFCLSNIFPHFFLSFCVNLLLRPFTCR